MTMKILPYLTAFALVLIGTSPLMAGDKEKKTEGAEISKTELVDSGTYQVTAHKVDPGEKEIYVKTSDGKILELYLKEETTISQGGVSAEFSALKEGQKLEVQVENRGNKLHPISVRIVE